ncbi:MULTISPECIES: lipopolysaccharide biosynthesis protein [Arenibacter]|uniref:lipopolysaccharide biosynthesis protein n=1 Tax=Arenibacter TaxID=178469 RepID=UPI0012FFF467|nr:MULTISPECIES: lipopolysaccharide biosynthesis protein [Arenibacter]
MNALHQKRILFISPKFFGYEIDIKNKLESLGAKVDFYDERPTNTFIVKALVRINKKLLSKKINKYYTDILHKTKGIKYDFIFFNSPESISKQLFLKLKKEHESSRFILYMWDSLKNKNANELLEYFDVRFSFDQQDCINRKIDIKYRPLFYVDDYSNLSGISIQKEYDLLFIGTLHSDRNKILNQIRTECQKQGLNYFFYLYFPSKILYLIKRIYDRTLWGTKLKDFKFVPLSKNELVNYVEKSNAILDIQHPKQNGLTIRTIEMLGASRKLITTNQDIVNYDFYNPTNIKVIDRNQIQLEKKFFDKAFEKGDKEIIHKYSLEGWITEIFNPVNM